MKKKATLERSWLFYSANAIAVLAMSPNADAQIIAVDIDPDVQLNSNTGEGPYGIDFDGDGVEDLTLMGFGSSSIASANIEAGIPVGNGIIADPAYADFFSPQALAYGAVIGAGNADLILPPTAGVRFRLAATFSSTSSFAFASGNWFVQNDTVSGYLGVRFVAGDGLDHYGWVELSVIDGPYVLRANIKAYGYEQRPDHSIAAGDVGLTTGVPERDGDLSVQVSPNPGRSNIMVSVGTKGEGPMDIAILDGLGRNASATRSMGSAPFSLDISDLEPGAYFIRVQQGKQVAYRRVVKY